MANVMESGRAEVARRREFPGWSGPRSGHSGEQRAGAMGEMRASGRRAGRFRLLVGSACGLLLLSGCETRQTLETELYITELETQVMQLDGELNAAYQEVSRLSGLLTTQVTGLEGSVNDLNLRVLDLPAAQEPAMAIREVEAAVAVIRQRVVDLKGTSSTLAAYLQ